MTALPDAPKPDTDLLLSTLLHRQANTIRWLAIGTALICIQQLAVFAWIELHQQNDETSDYNTQLTAEHGPSPNALRIRL